MIEMDGENVDKLEEEQRTRRPLRAVKTVARVQRRRS